MPRKHMANVHLISSSILLEVYTGQMPLSSGTDFHTAVFAKILCLTHKYEIDIPYLDTDHLW